MRISIVISFILWGTVFQAQELSLLTYNIKYDAPKDTINGWANRKDFLISQLSYNNPDIFGTQEGLYNQLEDIKSGLNGYSYFGVGRDNGDQKGEFTAIFYNTSKVTLLEQDTFWLSDTPSVPSLGWDASFKRICTYGKFKLQHTSKEFLVFNTHFDHMGVKAREESALLILKKIAEINTEELPVILMGDFNLEVGSVGIHSILKKYKDTHKEANVSFGPVGTFNGFQFEEPVSRKIDFIFTSKDIQVLKSGILSDSKDCKYPSDHFPVYVELRLSRH
tara:strand:+ start:1754 stop:2587 length:834 start_codon:yes stop_codon:yes gene_type:complete